MHAGPDDSELSGNDDDDADPRAFTMKRVEGGEGGYSGDECWRDRRTVSSRSRK